MKCKVCSSKYVDEINKRLAAREFTGETLETIARDYRKISYSSLQRHNQNCLHHEDQEDLAEDDIKDIELEDLRDKALEHYDYAIKSGNTKLADSALGHLIRIEDLISRRDDRALAAGKDDEVIEIEIRWADDKPMQDTKQDNPDSHDDGEMLPEIELQESEEPTIEDYKRLALEARPTELVRDETGEIIGIRTEAGFIPKQKEPLPLDPPLHVDADFEEIDDKLNDGNPHLMPDGSVHQRYGVNKKSKYDIPEAFSC